MKKVVGRADDGEDQEIWVKRVTLKSLIGSPSESGKWTVPEGWLEMDEEILPYFIAGLRQAEV